MVSDKPLGLIAGKGALPRIVCDTAASRGISVAAVAFDRETARQIDRYADVKLVGIGQADKVIRYFLGAAVHDVCLAGKIEKVNVFRNPALDRRTLKLMKKIALSKSDSSIMNVVIEELESEGFKVAKQTDWLPGLLPKKGLLGSKKPNVQVTADFEFGVKICREMAARDIGQTIIVKEGVVLAVEAVEGTSAAIERGCRLGGKDCVMIKQSRPKQDFRFDTPSVGPDTVKLLAKYKAAGLALEAGRTLAIEREKMISICDRAGIAFAAL